MRSKAFQVWKERPTEPIGIIIDLSVGVFNCESKIETGMFDQKVNNFGTLKSSHLELEWVPNHSKTEEYTSNNLYNAFGAVYSCFQGEI